MFDQVMARIAGRFGRVEPRATARAYVLGLLSGVERKNCWRLAPYSRVADSGGVMAWWVSDPVWSR
jgi:hypothetical protein